MAAERLAVSRRELTEFSGKLSTWAAGLDGIGQAMLWDLLAKAGGDVYGNVVADHAASPSGKSIDAGDLSPLELDDFEAVIKGIFIVGDDPGAR
jgi:hypothetical protein